jgi:hypothetical protein
VNGDKGSDDRDDVVPGSSLRAGFSLSDLELPELWLAYVGLGGSLGKDDLEAALRGTLPLSDHEHDMIAQALNDYFTERGQDHPVAYANEEVEHDRRAAHPREG